MFSDTRSPWECLRRFTCIMDDPILFFYSSVLLTEFDNDTHHPQDSLHPVIFHPKMPSSSTQCIQ